MLDMIIALKILSPVIEALVKYSRIPEIQSEIPIYEYRINKSRVDEGELKRKKVMEDALRNGAKIVDMSYVDIDAIDF